MKNLIYTLIAIITLTSCQDKFEQIDANFAFLDEKVEANVNDLQSQIDANKVAISDLNVKLDSDIAALTTYVDQNLELSIEADVELSKAIDALVVADENTMNYIDEMNAIQDALISATVSDVTDLQSRYNTVAVKLDREFIVLETELRESFTNINNETALSVAEFLMNAQLDTQSIVFEVINQVIDVVAPPVVNSGTASGTLFVKLSEFIDSGAAEITITDTASFTAVVTNNSGVLRADNGTDDITGTTAQAGVVSTFVTWFKSNGYAGE